MSDTPDTQPQASIAVMRIDGSEDKATMSIVTINGTPYYGLEPSKVNPVHEGHPAIPAGTYQIAITMSPHLEYETPELIGVPDRSEIRIHVGNYPKDSLGCLIVGKSEGSDGQSVLESKEAFTELMAWIKGLPKLPQVVVFDA